MKIINIFFVFTLFSFFINIKNAERKFKFYPENIKTDRENYNTDEKIDSTLSDNGEIGFAIESPEGSINKLGNTFETNSSNKKEIEKYDDFCFFTNMATIETEARKYNILKKMPYFLKLLQAPSSSFFCHNKGLDVFYSPINRLENELRQLKNNNNISIDFFERVENNIETRMKLFLSEEVND